MHYQTQKRMSLRGAMIAFLGALIAIEEFLDPPPYRPTPWKFLLIMMVALTLGGTVYDIWMSFHAAAGTWIPGLLIVGLSSLCWITWTLKRHDETGRNPLMEDSDNHRP